MSTIFHIMCLLMQFSSTFSLDNSLENETINTVNDVRNSTIESIDIAFEDSMADISSNETIDKVVYSVANSITNSVDDDDSDLGNLINTTGSISENYITELHENDFTNATLMNIGNGVSNESADYVPADYFTFSPSGNSLDGVNSSELINHVVGNVEVVSDGNYNANNDFHFNFMENENEIEISTESALERSENVHTSSNTIPRLDSFNGGYRKSLINYNDKFDSHNIAENVKEEQSNACADCPSFTDGIYQDISYEPRHVKRNEENSMYAPYRGNSIHKQHIKGNVLSSTENVFTILPTFQDVYTPSTEGLTNTENILNYLYDVDASTVSGNDDKDIEEKYENLTITNATFESDVMSTIPTNGSIIREQMELEDSIVDSVAEVTTIGTLSSVQNDASVNFVTVTSDVNTFNNVNAITNFNYTTWPVRHSAVVEGDLILGGLMMVHSREDTITCGPIMPQGGIQALEAMLFTIDRINEIGLLPNIKLGAHILDDCDKDTYGLEMAVDFIKACCGDLRHGSCQRMPKGDDALSAGPN